MDVLKQLYSFAFKAKELNDLIKALIIYVVIDIVCGLVIGLLTKLPIVGFLFVIIGGIAGLYALGGIIISLLVFFKVLKD